MSCGPAYDITRPPVPVAGCETCARLAGQRADGLAKFDRSAASDMNVLMRRHQQQEHT